MMTILIDSTAKNLINSKHTQTHFAEFIAQSSTQYISRYTQLFLNKKNFIEALELQY